MEKPIPKEQTKKWEVLKRIAYEGEETRLGDAFLGDYRRGRLPFSRSGHERATSNMREKNRGRFSNSKSKSSIERDSAGFGGERKDPGRGRPAKKQGPKISRERLRYQLKAFSLTRDRRAGRQARAGRDIEGLIGERTEKCFYDGSNP